MRVVFAGTPTTALPGLEAIAASDHELVGVVSRPDAPAGRGRRLTASPVALRAAELGVPVLKPIHPRDPEFHEELRRLNPAACPVIAYGALLPPSVLEIPTHGWINLHFSLLPAWRGAAPVQHAIWAGDEVTGATTFRLVKELDAGPTFGVMTEQVRARDTAGDLLARLAEGGAHLLVATLDGIADGSLEARNQPTDAVSLAPKIEVEHARVDWTQSARAIDRQVRACSPSPGAWTTLGGERIKLGPLTALESGSEPGRDSGTNSGPDPGPDPGPDSGPDSGSDSGVTAGLRPGEVAIGKREVRVGTGAGDVRLGDVKAHGKRAMPASDWARGLRDRTPRFD